MNSSKFAIIEQVMARYEGLDCRELASKILANSNMTQVECTKVLADWYYSKKDYVNCLIACGIHCTAKECNDQLLAVVKEYFKDFIELAKQYYEENRRLLSDYQWYIGEPILPYDTLDLLLIYQDDSRIIYFERSTGNISVAEKDTDRLTEIDDKVIFAAGINNIAALVNIRRHCIMDVYQDLWMKRPFYIYYKAENELALALQTGNISELIASENSVFFMGWDNAELFLSDPQSHPIDNAVFNNTLTEEERNIIISNILNLAKAKNELYTKLHNDNIAWYREHASLIKENIRSGKPKILFVTSRFTTAVQYHNRDCMESCRQLGCRVDILIEKSDIHGSYNCAYIKMINEFKPDIIFVIDHFRNKGIMPPEIVHVCWAQDPLPHIVNKSTPATLDDNQYMLDHYPPLKELLAIGYDKAKIMAAPIPASEQTYRPYEMTANERQKYAANIILVANASCYETHLQGFRKQFANYGKEVIDGCIDIFNQYYKLVYEGKIKSDFREDMYAYLRKALQSLSQPVNLVEENFTTVAEYFYLYTRPAVFRAVLGEWLIDGGYTNLKLYGRDWGDNPKFAPYAMGAAANGEPLAKIYQAAKITLGTNSGTTGAARFYECYLSGGFYISNYIDPVVDAVDLRDRFAEGKEIPFFYNRQDLYDKLDYYLANEAERQKISNRVREKMLQKYTYKALMKGMLQWLGEKAAGEVGIKGSIGYLTDFQKALDDTVIVSDNKQVSCMENFDVILNLLKIAKANKNQLFFIGNGGSAAIAQHMTVDYLKNGGMRTHSMHDAATLTCLGNDFGYEHVFSKQLEVQAEQGDVLVAISSSGNSVNITKAVEVAKAKQCHVITLSGFRTDNQLRQIGDVNIYVPSSSYGIVESIHNMILQMLVDLLVEEDGVGLK